MQYTDNEQWIEKIELIDEWEKVLGGIDGPDNRPNIQLADRTAWLRKQQRIPIYGDLTLNITTTGDDETGDLTHPFRHPQAAYDWAVGNLDFRHVDKLTIQCGSGTFNGLTAKYKIQGLKKVCIIGNGISNTTTGLLEFDNTNMVFLGDFTVPATANQVGVNVINTHVFIDGTLNISDGGVNSIALFTQHGGLVKSKDSSSVLNISGTYNAMIMTEFCGSFDFGKATMTFNGTCNEIFHCDMAGVVYIENANISGSVVGKKYYIRACSVFFSNGAYLNIPGSPGEEVGVNVFGN